MFPVQKNGQNHSIMYALFAYLKISKEINFKGTNYRFNEIKWLSRKGKIKMCPLIWIQQQKEFQIMHSSLQLFFCQDFVGVCLALAFAQSIWWGKLGRQVAIFWLKKELSMQWYMVHLICFLGIKLFCLSR